MDPSDPYAAWLGRTEERRDTVTATPVRALAATLDRDDPAPRRRRPRCRRCWHWLYFLPLHRAVARSAPTATRSAAASCRRCRCRAACGPAAGIEFLQPLRVGDAIDAHVAHRRRRAASRGAPGRSSSSTCATRSPTAAGVALRRGARHRLPRPARSRAMPRARRRGRAGRRDVRARDRPRRRAAVPLLGAHLQRPPHPLRPPLRHRGRGLSRAWSCTGR